MISDDDIFEGTGDAGLPKSTRKTTRRTRLVRSTTPKRPFGAWAKGTPFATHYQGLMKLAVRPDDSERGKDREEEGEQRACVRWFNSEYSHYAGLLMASLGDLLMTPGLRGSAIARGYVSGTPDFTLAVAKRGYFGFYCELKKDGGGVTSDEQKEMLARLARQGYFTCVAHGLREFSQYVIWYLDGDDTTITIEDTP